MSVYEKIKQKLDDLNIEYEVLEHDPVYTSEEAAAIRDADLSMGAKALVVLADGKPALCVIPGDTKLKSSKARKTLKAKDVRFATPDKVTELTTLKIGSIPPVGSAMGLQSYFDESFLQKDIVAFNAGDHSISIKMKASDLIKAENPVISSLT